MALKLCHLVQGIRECPMANYAKLLQQSVQSRRQGNCSAYHPGGKGQRFSSSFAPCYCQADDHHRKVKLTIIYWEIINQRKSEEANFRFPGLKKLSPTPSIWNSLTGNFRRRLSDHLYHLNNSARGILGLLYCLIICSKSIFSKVSLSFIYFFFSKIF